MGIRKSAQTERQGCRGMWAVRFNAANVRPSVVVFHCTWIICVQPYSHPLRWNADMEVGAYVERKLEIEQRECGAFPPSLGARPALRLPPVPTGMR